MASLARLTALLVVVVSDCLWADPHVPADVRAANVDELVMEQMRAKEIPGLQIAVVVHEKPVFEKSYGIANLQTPVAVTNETVFPINSITKAFTGVAVMKLVETSQVSLDAPVRTYLDGLPPAWQPVTIRQLLTHMSGIPDINSAPGASDLNANEAAIWAWVTARPMYFKPGERFNYCQTNYSLLQKVTNQFNGQPPEAPLAYAQIRIAGMTHTTYGDSTEVIPDAATAYRLVRKNSADPGSIKPSIEVNLPFVRASRGMMSTAGDMAKWIIALQQGRILARSSLETLWMPAAFNDGRPGGWGLGWEVMKRPGHRCVGMTGASRAAFFIYPDDDMAVVILTNLSGTYPEDFIDQVAALYGLKLTGMAALRVELVKRNFRDGAAILAELGKDEPDLFIDETELNDWGYRLLATGQQENALEVLKLVPLLYPKSGNAYDSLGEAYAAVGDNADAVASYNRSLELDPNNTNATRQLRTLNSPAMSRP